jgi:hypothetical protein
VLSFGMLAPVTTLADLRRRALRSLIPPPRLKLSTWIDENIRLPEGVSALSGAVVRARHPIVRASRRDDPKARFSRLTNGRALECGVGFRQLRTCRRTRQGRQWAIRTRVRSAD